MSNTKESQDAYECAISVRDNRIDRLTSWEHDFIASVIEQFDTKGFLTEKQVARINYIYDDKFSRS